MANLPTFVSDLALILISAGAFALLFRWLKQPLVLGYIVAGILIGPHIGFFPNVTDVANVEIWSEIGVIFLLFALGLEFSFKKLLNVGSSAFIIAGTELVIMVLVGFIIGQILGWTMMNSVFLGAMLSMSSTTIVIKTIGDLGLKSKKFVSIVFGTLVVEDLIAVLLMVFLSTIAVNRQFEGMEMLTSLVKLAFFLIIWFLVWIFVLPTVFNKAKKWLNDETLLIISIGLCLLMVVLATKAGFSSALGAFLMGSILAETLEGERIEKLVVNIKNLFGAIFFVSVGMMIDPRVILEYKWIILILALTVIIFKSFSAFLGSLLSGQLFKTSVQVGGSLGQIGEFSFILASLGYSLGVIDKALYPIIVIVSVITIFVTPYSIRLSEPFADRVYPRLPEKFRSVIEKYSEGTSNVNASGDWHKLIKNVLLRLILFSAILFAIMVVSKQWFYPLLMGKIPNVYGKLIYAAATIIVMSPFLRGIVVNKKSTGNLMVKLWNDKKNNRGVILSLMLFRAFVATFFIVMVLFQAFHHFFWFIIPVAVVVVTVILVSRRSLKRYSKIEERFITNLNQKEQEQKANNPLKTEIAEQLSDRDIHIERVTVLPDSIYVGQQIKKTNIRQVFGVNIVKIIRGSHTINLPGGDEIIYPYDDLIILGTDAQIMHFTEDVEKMVKEVSAEKQEVFLKSFVVEPTSAIVGKTIQECGIRAKTGCLVVGVERAHKSMMNPYITTMFLEGDLVWVVGEKKQIQLLVSQML